MTKILIVEDEPNMVSGLRDNFEFEGYEVLTAADGLAGLETALKQSPDLVLLDVMMPSMDGFTVCQRVREFSAVPIIIVTARGQDQDKMRGLDLGADDYLTKPFSVDELLARVRAVVRRSQFSVNEQTQHRHNTVTIGDLAIDYTQHLVTMKGKEVPLTPIEYGILAYLAQNAGRVVTQNLLLEHVWGAEYSGESHMLQVNVNRMRRKLEPEPTSPCYLLTKVGVGYLLATSPARLTA